MRNAGNTDCIVIYLIIKWLRAQENYLGEPGIITYSFSVLLKCGSVLTEGRAVKADHLIRPYFFINSITLSFGNSSTLCPSVPTVVVAIKSEFTIASSVASIAARKSGET